ncbi:diguanylate cyclase domain-containing protein [Actinoplanes sp. CA-030573]|uniref:diguanylate cyclase domain-containing protein n=1 Tax=Actinoplanes sp. CA-030573 TaxID=3239898 RepID=UPI003D931D6D
MTGRTFGILSPFVGGDYYGAIIEGVNAAAVAGGDRVMAIQTLGPGAHSADRSGLPDFRRPLAWSLLDGLVVLPGAVDPAYAAGARAGGLPVVFVAQDATDIGCSSVLADNRSGVREAVTHLVGHGHERIAFAGHLAHFDLRERHEGYREGLLAHGIVPRAELLFDTGDNHESGGEAVAGALIRAGMPATAIVLGTDRNAIGLTSRLTAAGYDLPGELAVAGFDDIADATYQRPSLATVRQPLDELGAAAYGTLAERAADPRRAAFRRHVATSFVRRDSCGCPGDGLPVSEPQARALFAQVQLLQGTLNIQYELGIELLGTHSRDPRALEWLGLTPAIAGCLGLWTPGDDTRLEVVGDFRAGCDTGTALAPGEFPPPRLFELTDGPAGDIVFLVPVRSRNRDWGVLAAVGRIQSTTPPGREMMNHSGALLAAALDYEVMMAALREQEQSLRDAALHDHLTGLPNRTLLEDRMEQAAMRSARRPGYRFAILLLDLDGFKAVNDTLGHAAGDQLLIEVARRLTGLLRKSDTVARLGGDEFVILLDGFAPPHGHQAVGHNIAAAISAPFFLDGERVDVGASIGVAVSGPGSSDPDHLLREADAAMYRAKSAARRPTSR